MERGKEIGTQQEMVMKEFKIADCGCSGQSCSIKNVGKDDRESLGKIMLEPISQCCQS